MVQRVAQVNPKFILGKGKMAELEVLALEGRAGTLVFDGELSPAQLHNLADITERKVLDRTQLILDIFAQHAVTRAGKLQVELAQLRYTQPRLTGKNRAMDRLMGGIGGRGPGETKLETDRRRSRERMARLRKELDQLRRQRAFTRSRRARRGIPMAALVGYTNAGKSTLLNNLTRSEVLAENKLFATLDPTTRRLRFPAEREIILADTVGFIRNLPKELMDAFRATLEELESADLLVHVADASHPDLLQQITSVETILEELELQHMPRILLLNKWDLLDVPARAELADAFPHAIPISARTGDGLKRLLEVLENMLLSTQQSQLDQLSEMKALLAAGVITAPEDGIVSSIVSPSAAEAEAHSTLASLYVGDQKEMVVSVDELDIINVQVGQNADIAMDALTDKTYSAVVSKVSQIGTSESGVTVYDVTLTIDGDENLKFGMNGTATIRIEELNDVLLVPLTALNTSRGESYVWLQSDSASADEPGVRTTVETGLSDENYAQVLSGLNEGDVVLITREASSSGTDSQSGGFDFGGMSFDIGSMPQGGGDMPGGGSNGGGGNGGSGNGGGGNGGGPGGNR